MLNEDLKLIMEKRLADNAFIKAFAGFGFQIKYEQPKKMDFRIPYLVTADKDIPFAVPRNGQLEYRKKIDIINDVYKMLRKINKRLKKEDAAIEEFVDCLREYAVKNYIYRFCFSHGVEPVYMKSPEELSGDAALAAAINQKLFKMEHIAFLKDISLITKSDYMRAITNNAA